VSDHFRFAVFAAAEEAAFCFQYEKMIANFFGQKIA